ncbi:MAG: hypothetical protein IT342_12995 [Candidatus Melainabacteria bacterium]|nr:hypothetical protein [Candidatus Melainabacteria bacterium]
MPSQTRVGVTAGNSGGDVVALFFLMVALLSALSLVLPGVKCNECAIADALQPLPGLKWCGIFAYFFLFVASLRFGWNRWTSGTLFALLGTHLVLSGYLIYYQLLCWSCIICAFSIAIASVAAFLRKSVKWKDAVVVAGLSALAFGGMASLAWKIERIKIEDDVKQVVDFSHLTRLPDSRLTLYAFTADNCKQCLDFKQIDLKAVRSKFGDSVRICLKQAPPNLKRVPVIVLAGREKTLFIGRCQKTEKFLNRISERLTLRPED